VCSHFAKNGRFCRHSPQCPRESLLGEEKRNKSERVSPCNAFGNSPYLHNPLDCLNGERCVDCAFGACKFQNTCSYRHDKDSRWRNSARNGLTEFLICSRFSTNIYCDGRCNMQHIMNNLKQCSFERVLSLKGNTCPDEEVVLSSGNIISKKCECGYHQGNKKQRIQYAEPCTPIIPVQIVSIDVDEVLPEFTNNIHKAYIGPPLSQQRVKKVKKEIIQTFKNIDLKLGKKGDYYEYPIDGIDDCEEISIIKQLPVSIPMLNKINKSNKNNNKNKEDLSIVNDEFYFSNDIVNDNIFDKLELPINNIVSECISEYTNKSDNKNNNEYINESDSESDNESNNEEIEMTNNNESITTQNNIFNDGDDAIFRQVSSVNSKRLARIARKSIKNKAVKLQEVVIPVLQTSEVVSKNIRYIKGVENKRIKKAELLAIKRANTRALVINKTVKIRSKDTPLKITDNADNIALKLRDSDSDTDSDDSDDSDDSNDSDNDDSDSDSDDSDTSNNFSNIGFGMQKQFTLPSASIEAFNKYNSRLRK
jgi:hypothetical protein